MVLLAQKSPSQVLRESEEAVKLGSRAIGPVGQLSWQAGFITCTVGDTTLITTSTFGAAQLTAAALPLVSNALQRVHHPIVEGERRAWRSPKRVGGCGA
jgi:hypothetical protein